jgi:hypothetical protein
MKTTIKYLSVAQKDLCDRFYKDTDIDLSYIIENNRPEDIDELMEELEESANEIECIYYNNAMTYLSENDPSLQTSLGIAHELGMTADNLNSETLATLLMQQNAREAIYEYKDELEEVLFNNEQ